MVVARYCIVLMAAWLAVVHYGILRSSTYVLRSELHTARRDTLLPLLRSECSRPVSYHDTESVVLYIM